MIRLQHMVLSVDEPVDAALLYETVRDMNEGVLEPLEMKFSCDMRRVEVSGTRVKLYSLLDVLYLKQLREKLASSTPKSDGSTTLREQFAGVAQHVFVVETQDS